MRRVLILVEGQTEETFVRDVLGPHLLSRGLAAAAAILKTKRVKSGLTFRGGVTSTSQVLGDLRRLCRDSDAAAITTLLDYYGLAADFPGISGRLSSDPYERVAAVENAFATAIGDARFLPHLVLHEFEAWVFSEPSRCAWVFDDNANVLAEMENVRNAAGGPERIDEGPETAPSKRLAKIVPRYSKPLHGPMAVAAVGLQGVRARCQHFDAWLTRLEAV
jgi:hypothetical protein